MLNVFIRYKPSHESALFSIDDAKDVMENLISVFTAVQNPKYPEKPSKSVIWLIRIMKEHKVDYVKDSNKERLNSPKNEAKNVSLKHSS